MTFLRSIAIYSATLLWTLIFWPVMLVPLAVIGCCLPAKKRRYWGRRFLLAFGEGTIRLAWRPFFKVEYRDCTGGVRVPGIVVVNHRSAIDGFLVARPGLAMAQTVNGWPLRIPVLGWGAKYAGYLNITEWNYETLKVRAAEILSTGDMIVSYPEGTRSECRRMNPFRSGIFRVARELGVPIYPLCIAGNEYMPDRRFRFREFRNLKMRFLRPLSAEEVRSSSSAYVLKMKIFRMMNKELESMDDELENETSL